MWGVRHIEYWVTSDGRTFPTEKEANDWQKLIDSPDYQTKTYCEGNSKTLASEGLSIEEIVKRQLSDIKF